jgi:hypothetical protein
VQGRSNRSAVLAVLTLSAALAGCANPEVFQSNERWFQKPLDWSGRNGGYTFSELQKTRDRQRPVTAADLVSANGACPPPAVTAMPSTPMPGAPMPGAPMPTTPAATASEGPGAMPPADSSDPLLGQGIALGMTECEVVWRAGAPSSVQFGSNPKGNRTAVLTYDGGPRSGIYRFEAGRLMDMDRVEAAAAEEPKLARRQVKKRKPRQQVNTEQITTE